MTQEAPKRNNNTKWMAILVVVIAVIIVGWWIINWLNWIMYGMIFLLILIPMIMNRKLVAKVFNYLKGLYQKHTALGILGTIGGVIGFLPFAAFLLIKTLWEYFKPKKESAQNLVKENSLLEDSSLSEGLNLSEKSTDDLFSGNDSKFPPTEQ